MDMPSYSVDNTAKGKQKEISSNKKETRSGKELQQHEYNDIIKYIINDKKGYISTFGDTDLMDGNAAVLSINAFLKCKNELVSELQKKNG